MWRVCRNKGETRTQPENELLFICEDSNPFVMKIVRVQTEACCEIDGDG
jgi:hypothetical protein